MRRLSTSRALVAVQAAVHVRKRLLQRQARTRQLQRARARDVTAFLSYVLIYDRILILLFVAEIYVVCGM